ncbi:hypothetical protein AB434_0071 [Heyndrickxia coagulans]|nr:hypothetical protein AB434_0071 [Heyndrickxia coagulans]
MLLSFILQHFCVLVYAMARSPMLPGIWAAGKRRRHFFLPENLRT